jgi:hypothetical protein
MNEANWAKIGHFLGPLFLGNESNVGGVEPMKVTCVEIGELVDDRHDVNLDGVPTSLEESSRETIRPRSLVTCGVVDRGFNLLLRKRLTKTRKITLWRRDCCPIEVFGMRRASLDYRLEVAMDDSFLMVMLRDPTIIVFKAMNVVLSSSSIDAKVEKPRVCISLLEICDS